MYPVDGAVPVVRRRAPAAPEGAGPAAPAHRPPCGVRDVPRAGAARAVDAQGTRAREHVHQGGAGRTPSSTTTCSRRCRIRRMRTLILDAGFEILRENLHQTRTFRRLPGPVARWLRDSPLTQDVVVGAVEYVLRIDDARDGRPRARHHGRHRSLPPRGPPRDRRAVPPRVRARRGRRQPPALGLAVRPEPEHAARRPADLAGARGPDHRRAVRDDAGAAHAEGSGDSGLVGHGRHGGAGAPAAGHRRGAVPHLGSERRRVARPRPLALVAPPVQEDEVARGRARCRA